MVLTVAVLFWREGCADRLQQCFSKSSMSQNHLEGLRKQIFESVDLGYFTFLTSSQMLLVLLVWEPLRPEFLLNAYVGKALSGVTIYHQAPHITINCSIKTSCHIWDKQYDGKQY